MATGEITDTEDIQFKIRSSFETFKQSTENKNGYLGLLAVSSSVGLLFAGNPNMPEIKVYYISQMVNAKDKGESVMARVVAIQANPINMACSCDGSLLGVNVMLNGSGFLSIYNVKSFLTPNIQIMYNIRLSADVNVYANHILWCPVVPNIICVILNNGGVCMYTLNKNGQYDLNSIDKTQQVKCGCWSPKGKQIVFGYSNGKLQQYKPNLTPVKAIECPPNIHPGPSNIIALHWLSTYQFAAIFLQDGEETYPALYIINAPKGATPNYMHFTDVCYSNTGLRTHQFIFNHIQKWNLLLVASANGIEVGVLRTTETSDTPKWTSLALIGEGRIEMPLVSNVDETFPIGFAMDTSSLHQVIMGEQQLPIMPMVHVLSTHGHLVSYDFLNLTPGAVDICSPPPPIGNLPPEFKAIDYQDPVAANSSEVSFHLNSNAVTSTPAPMKDNSQGLFGNLASGGSLSDNNAPLSIGSGIQSAVGNQQAFTSLAGANFGAPGDNNVPSSLGSLNAGVPTKPAQFVSKPLASSLNLLTAPSATTFGSGISGDQNSVTASVKLGGTVPSSQPLSINQNPLQLLEAQTKQELNVAAPTTPTTTKAETTPVTNGQTIDSKTKKELDRKQPLYTVTEDYKPPEEIVKQSKELYHLCAVTDAEIERIRKEIMFLLIQNFNDELKLSNEKVSKLFKEPIQPSSMKQSVGRLYSLQELMDQAKDLELQKEVQKILQNLEECFEIMSESRYRIESYKNVDSPQFRTLPYKDKIAKRQLTKIENGITRNQSQLQFVQYQIDTLWADHQDTLRRQSKHEMHIPCMEAVYQRLTELKRKVVKSRTDIEDIKQKLKEKGYKIVRGPGVSHQLPEPRSEAGCSKFSRKPPTYERVNFVDNLSEEKWQYLRQLAKQYQVTPVRKPKRPAREHLNSEVILEYKERLEKQAKEKLQKEKEVEVIKNKEQHAKVLQQTTKQNIPISDFALKPLSIGSKTEPNKITAPAPTTGNIGNLFSFGGNSSFVKTSFTSKEPVVPSTPTSVPSTFNFSAGSTTPFAFGQNKSQEIKPQQIPISFSAKVITSDADNNKSSANVQGSQKLQEQGTFPLISPSLDKTGAKASTSNSQTSSSASGFGSLAASFGVSNFGSSPGVPSFSFGQVGKSAANIDQQPSICSITTSLKSPAVVTTAISSSSVPVKPSPVNISSSSAPPTLTTTTNSSFGSVGYLVKPAASVTSNIFAPASTDPSDNLFGNLNICKPNAVVSDTSKSVNIFSGLTGNSSKASSAISNIFTPVTTSAVAYSGSVSKPSTSELSTTTTFSSISKPIATTATTTAAPASSFAFGSLSVTPKPAASTTASSPPASFSLSTSQSTTGTNTFSTPTTFVASAFSPQISVSTVLSSQVIAVTTAAAAPKMSTTPATTTEASVVPSTATTTAAAVTSSSTSNITTCAPAALATETKPFAGTAPLSKSVFGQPVISNASNIFGGFSPSGFGVNTASPTVTGTTTVSSTASAINLFASSKPAPNVNLFANLAGSTASTGISGLTTATASTTITPIVSTPIGSTPIGSTPIGSTPIGSTPIGSTAPASIFVTDPKVEVTSSAIVTTSAVVTAAATNIFGVAVSTGAPAMPQATNIFGAAIISTAAPVALTPATNIFGVAVASTTATVTPAAGTTIFGSPQPAAPAGVIFGAAPSPVSPPTGLFAAAAIGAPSATPGSASPFGTSLSSPAPGNIFGGGTPSAPPGGSIFASANASAGATVASSFGPPAGGCIFGSPTPAPNTSIFGGAATSPSQSCFGSPAPNQATSGGSIFGQPSVFGQSNAASSTSGGSIFGGGQQMSGSIFGGGAAANAQAGGSIFGGGGAGTASSVFGSTGSTSGFGSFSQPSAGLPFGSPTGSGSFAQGGASVAQTGFGSAQQSAFAKPVFGGTPTFGSGNPAFGAAHTFGGAPTFGNPKAFGTFGASPVATSPNANTSFGTQQNNLFETLGSSEAGLSFGNLAQTNPNQQQQQQQKPVFGGSKFMNYRA